MFSEIKKDTTARMQKCISALKSELSKIRTGRAHPSLLEHVKVSYYGNETPLNQVASINVGDVRTLLVTPWEKHLTPEIEKAIRNADLGLNPSTSGQSVRVPLPALTEERRKELIKLVRHEGENARIAIRNIRRDANNKLKELLKDKTISEDEDKRYQDEVQKLTDNYIKEVDNILEQKEAELMEI